MSSNDNNSFCKQQSESDSSAYCAVLNHKMDQNMDNKPGVTDNLLPITTKDHHSAVLSYHKLKISFMCMLILNALLLVVVIICMVLIVPHIATDSSNSETPSLEKLQSAHMKCQSIKNKLNRLYRNGQMVDDVKDGDKCSMEDLLDSFIQHVEDSMQKEKANLSSAFHLVSNNTDTARCQDSRTLYCLKNWKLSMNTTKINVNDESIVVPSSGAYFLYSRVVINAKLNSNLQDLDTITHSIRYSNTGHNFNDLETSSIKCGVIKNTMSHISYIEKIQYLEKDSMIKVALDFPRDVSIVPSVSTGAFGMFKL